MKKWINIILWDSFKEIKKIPDKSVDLISDSDIIPFSYNWWKKTISWFLFRLNGIFCGISKLFW